ncbi:hypothetical protein [Streptococcus sp. DD10]|uniref:hypothetical protein n=1 Tax=Streptococcus sp. DD10 TaxID=1777878 RepID=UPI0008345BE0|nr:hypothetical protein [Streptococcus sp. DD10]
MKVKELQEKIKTYLTRPNLEKAGVGLILLSLLGVLVGSIGLPGSLTLAGGKLQYEGTVQRGKMNGQGTLTYENGDTYTGSFKNGTFNGYGTFTSKQGWKYEGEFVSGVPEGKGKLTTEGRVVYEGNFKQGIYQNAN